MTTDHRRPGRVVRHHKADRDVHPMWCATDRCLSPYADPAGGHRSDPMIAPVPGGGRVVLTLAQRRGGHVYLDVNVVIEAPASGPQGQLAFAQKLISELAETAATAVGLNRLEARRDALLAGAVRAAIAAGGN